MNGKLGLGALALAVAVGLGLWTLNRGPETAETSPLSVSTAHAQETTGSAEPAAAEPTPPEPTAAATDAAAIEPAPADAAAVDGAPEIKDMSLGNTEAKVHIIEYASYTCPHCANFHEAVFKPLKADYIDTGLVQFTFREVFSDRYGLWAAMVARCSGEMRYFGVNGLLMEKQSEWAATNDPLVAVENLKTIGRLAGMDDASLNACMEDGALAKAMVETSEANRQADGVNATPTLMINGTVHSNMTYADLKKIIDEELAK